jgi:hypothetical protein
MGHFSLNTKRASISEFFYLSLKIYKLVYYFSRLFYICDTNEQRDILQKIKIEL